MAKEYEIKGVDMEDHGRETEFSRSFDRAADIQAESLKRLAKSAGVAPSKPQEIRVTDEKSGGQKGMKKARFDLLPWDSLWSVAEIYGAATPAFGGKYEDRNWEKGYKWSLSVSSIMRHLTLRFLGQRYDSESGQPHLAHVVWHALALLTFDLRGLGENDMATQNAVVGRLFDYLGYDVPVDTGSAKQANPTYISKEERLKW